jgi:RNA recognition motif-containing protein
METPEDLTTILTQLLSGKGIVKLVDLANWFASKTGHPFSNFCTDVSMAQFIANRPHLFETAIRNKETYVVLSKNDNGTIDDISPTITEQGQLCVQNISMETTYATFHKLFSKYGALTRCRKPKYAFYGFVAYENYSDAEKAKRALNYFKLDGRSIEVKWAKPRDNSDTLLNNDREPLVKYFDSSALDEKQISAIFSCINGYYNMLHNFN